MSAGRGGGRGSVAVDRLRIREVPPPARHAAAAGGLGLVVVGAGGGRGRRRGRHRLEERGRGDRALRGRPRLRARVRRPDPALEAGRARVALRRRAVAGPGHAGTRCAGSTEGTAGATRCSCPSRRRATSASACARGRATAYELAELEVEDLAFGATPNAFVQALAAESPRGRYPRGFHGEQPYWTIVGVEGGRAERPVLRGRRARGGQGRLLDRAVRAGRPTRRRRAGPTSRSATSCATATCRSRASPGAIRSGSCA